MAEEGAENLGGVYDALYAVSQDGDVEIHEQGDFQLENLQIAAALGAMYGVQCFTRFELNHHPLFDNQIDCVYCQFVCP
jgi:hypothetical protein